MLRTFAEDGLTKIAQYHYAGLSKLAKRTSLGQTSSPKGSILGWAKQQLQWLQYKPLIPCPLCLHKHTETGSEKREGMRIILKTDYFFCLYVYYLFETLKFFFRLKQCLLLIISGILLRNLFRNLRVLARLFSKTNKN